MICGLGIDIVQVDRFDDWFDHPHGKLEKILHQREIESYRTLRDGTEDSPVAREKSSAFLASRFAVKEAFFKALNASLLRHGQTDTDLFLIYVAKHVAVVRGVWGVPQLYVEWSAFEEKIGELFLCKQTHVSISHEKTHTVAMVVLEE